MRVAAVNFRVRTIRREEQFFAHVRRLVTQAIDQGATTIVLPELVVLELASLRESDAPEATLPAFLEAFAEPVRAAERAQVEPAERQPLAAGFQYPRVVAEPVEVVPIAVDSTHSRYYGGRTSTYARALVRDVRSCVTTYCLSFPVSCRYASFRKTFPQNICGPHHACGLCGRAFGPAAQQKPR